MAFSYSSSRETRFSIISVCILFSILPFPGVFLSGTRQFPTVIRLFGLSAAKYFPPVLAFRTKLWYTEVYRERPYGIRSASCGNFLTFIIYHFFPVVQYPFKIDTNNLQRNVFPLFRSERNDQIEQTQFQYPFPGT